MRLGTRPFVNHSLPSILSLVARHNPDVMDTYLETVVMTFKTEKHIASPSCMMLLVRKIFKSLNTNKVVIVVQSALVF